MGSSKSRTKRGGKKDQAANAVTTAPRNPKKSTGRYVSAEERGRYTRPVPNSVHSSPAWYGPFIVGVFLLGLATIILNYADALPGGTSGWYLLVGILIIFLGFAAMLRYH
jgi:hypothetical protein